MNAATSPLELARMAQKSIDQCSVKANTEAALIRQLMMGRFVRRKGETEIFKVTEVRMSLAWKIGLFGFSRSCRRASRHGNAIGNVNEVEVVETPAHTSAECRTLSKG